MKMCTECFELFDDSIVEDYCPRHKCDGDLVTVDSEIAWLIAELNKELAVNCLPIRTIYCCSGHHPDDYQAYLGLSVDECFFDTPEEATSYMNSFIDLFLKDPVEKLNQSLSKSPYFTIGAPYKAGCQILKEDWKECCSEIDTIYRIFISDFAPKYNDDVRESDLLRCRAISYIQNSFKEFLIEFIESIQQNTTEEFNVDTLCED